MDSVIVTENRSLSIRFAFCVVLTFKKIYTIVPGIQNYTATVRPKYLGHGHGLADLRLPRRRQTMTHGSPRELVRLQVTC